MGISKQVSNFGVPWEAQFGYAQAVGSGDWIYVSGQLSHDEAGKLVAPAPLDAGGSVTDTSTNMAPQLRRQGTGVGCRPHGDLRSRLRE